MNSHQYDIFGLDPIPFPPWAPGMPRWDGLCHYGHRRPRHDDPYTKETTKVAEIKDRFMKTRYKVALTDFDGMPGHDDLTLPDLAFQVTAVSYNYDEPLEILHRDFRDYDEAQAFFRRTVDQLQALAKLDSRDAQDIRIYADRTGYRRIDPDCCRNCKWARPADRRNCMFEEWRGRLRGKFFCMNSEIYKERMPDMAPDGEETPPPGPPMPPGPPPPGPWPHPGPHHRPEWGVLDVTPEVDPDGICDGYERMEKKTPPAPPPRPFPPPFPPPPPYVPGPLPYGRP